MTFIEDKIFITINNLNVLFCYLIYVVFSNSLIYINVFANAFYFLLQLMFSVKFSFDN